VHHWIRTIGMAAAASIIAVAVAAQDTGPTGQPTGPDGPHRGHWHGGWGWHMPPDQMCKERFAKEAGFLAYLGAKLELNDQQQAFWDAYQKAMTESATKQRQTCLDNVISPHENLTALERRDRIEKLLTARLEALRATRHRPPT